MGDDSPSRDGLIVSEMPVNRLITQRSQVQILSPLQFGNRLGPGQRLVRGGFAFPAVQRPCNPPPKLGKDGMTITTEETKVTECPSWCDTDHAAHKDDEFDDGRTHGRTLAS